MKTLSDVTRAVPENLRQGYDEIANMSKDECMRLWAQIHGQAIDILRKRAQLIFRFEQAGWDVHELGNGHAYYYQKIAYGQMLPELMLSVADPAILDRASKLPLRDQEKVAKNEKVSVLIGFNDANQPYFSEMELATLAPRHAARVLRGNKINSEAEQIADARQKKDVAKEPVTVRVRSDRRRNGAIVEFGTAITGFITRAQLEAVLSELNRK